MHLPQNTNIFNALCLYLWCIIMFFQFLQLLWAVVECWLCVMTPPSLRKRNDSAAAQDKQETHSGMIHEINTRRNQAATCLLSPITLMLGAVCTRLSFPMCDTVLHYASWPWCQWSSGVTLPVSINRWQQKIDHDESIFLDLVTSCLCIFTCMSLKHDAEIGTGHIHVGDTQLWTDELDTCVTSSSCVYWCVHVIFTSAADSPQAGYFSVCQQGLRFQAKEKNSELGDEQRQILGESVWFGVSVFLRRQSDEKLIGQGHIGVCRSPGALVNDRVTRWSAIILAVYPSLSLSDQPASCSSAPFAGQRNYTKTHRVKLDTMKGLKPTKDF